MMQDANAQSLDDFQWKHRVVLVIDGTSKNDDFAIQLDEFKKAKDGLIERKILLLEIVGNKVSDQHGKVYNTSLFNEISRVQSRPGKFEVILIGLDGGVKLRKSEMVSLQELYSLIDGMPMRKAEMRRRKN